MISRMRPSSDKSIWLRLLDMVFILVTVVVAIATLLGYAASWLSPEWIWWVAFLGLSLHLLMISNLVCGLYWLARLRWWAVLPGVVFLVGVGYIGDFVQPSLLKSYHDAEPQPDELSVMTYNVHNFHSYDNPTEAANFFDRVASYFGQRQPDVICMQEFAYDHAKDSARVASGMDAWPYSVKLLVPGYGTQVGLAIFSKYPVRLVDTLDFGNTANMAMAVNLVVQKDTIRLINCHLQSTEFNVVQPEGLEAVVESDHTKEKAQSIGSALKRNFIKRAYQAERLDSMVQASKYPQIVVGDFNDTPTSYAVSTVSRSLKDSFRAAGRGYQSTYRKMKSQFRIDYILYNDDHFDALVQTTEEITWSDHRPVTCRLRRLK